MIKEMDGHYLRLKLRGKLNPACVCIIGIFYLCLVGIQTESAFAERADAKTAGSA